MLVKKHPFKIEVIVRADRELWYAQKSSCGKVRGFYGICERGFFLFIAFRAINSIGYITPK